MFYVGSAKAETTIFSRLTIAELLGETKIDHFDVAFCIEQNVFGFQIPVCNSLLLVEKLEDEAYLSGVKL